MRRYECSECGADYAVIEIAARFGTPPIINCLHCGHPLPDDEGPLLVQYTLLKRPNPDILDDLWPSQPAKQAQEDGNQPTSPSVLSVGGKKLREP